MFKYWKSIVAIIALVGGLYRLNSLGSIFSPNLMLSTFINVLVPVIIIIIDYQDNKKDIV